MHHYLIFTIELFTHGSLNAAFTSHICSPGLRSQARCGDTMDGRIPLSILFSTLHYFSLLHFKH